MEGQPGRDFVSFAATDQRAAGRMAGQRLVKKLDERAKVVLSRKLAGSASTAIREEGFLKAVGAFPEIEVIIDDRHAGPTIGAACSERCARRSSPISSSAAPVECRAREAVVLEKSQ